MIKDLLKKRTVRLVLLFLAGLVFTVKLDATFFHMAPWFERHFDGIMRLAKEFGYLPFWFIAALVVLAEDWHQGMSKLWRRAGFLAVCATASGLAAEILKLIIRRNRPQPGLFRESIFRDWSGKWWKSNDLSTPSSHAAVAFGAAWALCILFPRARYAWLGIALLCGISRVAHQAHLPSDIYIAAWCGWLVALILRPYFIADNYNEERLSQPAV